MSSKKISNFEAEKLAKDLTKNNQEQISLIKKQLGQEMKSIVVARIPDKIKEAFLDKRCLKYLNTTACIRPVFNGQTYSWIDLDVAVPNTNFYSFHLDEEEFDKIKELVHKQEKAESDLRKLRSELKTAFKGLGSFKRIIEQFPKAAQFLDIQTNSLPQINFDNLRAQLA